MTPSGTDASLHANISIRAVDCAVTSRIVAGHTFPNMHSVCSHLGQGVERIASTALRGLCQCGHDEPCWDLTDVAFRFGRAKDGSLSISANVVPHPAWTIDTTTPSLFCRHAPIIAASFGLAADAAFGNALCTRAISLATAAQKDVHLCGTQLQQAIQEEDDAFTENRLHLLSFLCEAITVTVSVRHGTDARGRADNEPAEQHLILTFTEGKLVESDRDKLRSLVSSKPVVGSTCSSSTAAVAPSHLAQNPQGHLGDLRVSLRLTIYRPYAQLCVRERQLALRASHAVKRDERSCAMGAITALALLHESRRRVCPRSREAQPVVGVAAPSTSSFMAISSDGDVLFQGTVPYSPPPLPKLCDGDPSAPTMDQTRLAASSQPSDLCDLLCSCWSHREAHGDFTAYRSTSGECDVHYSTRPAMKSATSSALAAPASRSESKLVVICRAKGLRDYVTVDDTSALYECVRSVADRASSLGLFLWAVVFHRRGGGRQVAGAWRPQHRDSSIAGGLCSSAFDTSESWNAGALIQPALVAAMAEVPILQFLRRHRRAVPDGGTQSVGAMLPHQQLPIGATSSQPMLAVTDGSSPQNHCPSASPPIRPPMSPTARPTWRHSSTRVVHPTIDSLRRVCGLKFCTWPKLPSAANGTSTPLLGVARESVMQCHVLGQFDTKFIAAAFDGAAGTCLSSLPREGTCLQADFVLIADQHALHERARLEVMLHMGAKRFVQSVDTRLIRDNAVDRTNRGWRNDHNDGGRLHVVPRELAEDVVTYASILNDWGWKFAPLPHAAPHVADGEVVGTATPTRSAIPTVVVMTHCPLVCVEGMERPCHRWDDLAQFVKHIAEAPATCPPCVHRELVLRSCRGAIMFGDSVAPREAARLLMLACRSRQYRYCSHGRPAMAQYRGVPPTSHYTPLFSYEARR